MLPTELANVANLTRMCARGAARSPHYTLPHPARREQGQAEVR